MILKLLWIKWNIQKTYFWSYFWINIIFKIIFVTLFWVPPLPDAEEFDSPPKKFLPCLWKFSIPFPPLPLKIPKFLSHPQSRVGKTLCSISIFLSLVQLYLCKKWIDQHVSWFKDTRAIWNCPKIWHLGDSEGSD